MTMNLEKYPWKRYWCQRTASFRLDGDGFLLSPEGEYEKLLNSEVVSYEEIQNYRCLVFLGEPGIGKSDAITSIIESGKGNEVSHTNIHVDLRSCGSEERLIKAVFENELFIEWHRSGKKATLFLDSLDECLLRVDYAASVLADELKKYNLDGLSFRIACRTLNWPSILEEKLISTFGEKNVGVFELLPLTRQDVISAVQLNEINESSFISQIIEKEIVPFAIKPITLKLLINQYKRYGTLPEGQLELYARGCELLCNETNPYRNQSQNRDRINSADRLKIASLIAAATIFSNKYAIWTGIDFGDVPEEDVTINELSSYGFNEQNLRETLSSGLFTSRGLNRMGWAHQTYAEYLAAWFISESGFSAQQIQSIIFHPHDPEGKLVPQLIEVSAWLASLRPDIFMEIIKTDPDVLLRSDLLSLSEDSKVLLVKELLNHFNEEKIIDRNLDIQDRYHKLNHKGLESQIRPYIVDKTRGLWARKATIQMASVCGIQSCTDDLISIALDNSEIYQIRTRACYALRELCGVEKMERLMPLVRGEAGQDEDDELKGLGLAITWPGYLKTKEVFEYLTIPKRRNLLGAYRMFLSNFSEQLLDDESISYALDWAMQFAEQSNLDHSIKEMVHTIANSAWKLLENKIILHKFAQYILIRLKHYDQFSYLADLTSDDAKRHQMLIYLLGDLNDERLYDFCYLRFVLPSDLPWLVDQLLIEPSENKAPKWLDLIVRTYNISNAMHTELIFKAMESNILLKEKFTPWFESVELQSDQAKEQRKHHLDMQQLLSDRQEKRKKNILPIDQRIAPRIDRFEMGDIDEWWRLVYELSIDEDTARSHDYEPNLEAYPGWKKIDEITKTRIIRAAKKYIMEQSSLKETWFGTNTIYRPAAAGYKAIRLIYFKEPSFFKSLSKERWENWASVLLAQWTSSEDDEDKIQQELLGMAYSHVREQMILDLLFLIDIENENNSSVFIIRTMECCWDVYLVNAIIEKLRDKKIQDRAFKEIIYALAEHDDSTVTISFIHTFIKPEVFLKDEFRQKAIYAASALCLFSDQGWEYNVSIAEQSVQFSTFMKEVFLECSDDWESKKRINLLPEHTLASLYIVLLRLFPFSEDPNHDNEELAHWVGSREHVADLRDAILRLLTAKGNSEACLQMTRIIKEFPEVKWLKWTLLEAQANARRLLWTPVPINELMALAENSNRRLVQNGEQLMVVLMNSLDKIQKRLLGITPEVRWLWNDIGNKKFRPCTENEFSDYIKQKLEDELVGKGVIVNREVEIRRGFGDTKGERTDIHVNAIVANKKDSEIEIVTVIIEVKANWNRDILSSMEQQLAYRYMKDEKCEFGIYLVGWFEGEHWDTQDSRKRAAQRLNLDELSESLNQQEQILIDLSYHIRSMVMNAAL